MEAAFSSNQCCAVVTPAVDYTQRRGTTHINITDAVPIIVRGGNRARA